EERTPEHGRASGGFSRFAQKTLRNQCRLFRVVGDEAGTAEKVKAIDSTESAGDGCRGHALGWKSPGISKGSAEKEARQAIKQPRRTHLSVRGLGGAPKNLVPFSEEVGQIASSFASSRLPAAREPSSAIKRSRSAGSDLRYILALLATVFLPNS